MSQLVSHNYQIKGTHLTIKLCIITKFQMTFRLSNKLLWCAECVNNSLNSATKRFLHTRFRINNSLSFVVMRNSQWICILSDLLCGCQCLNNLYLLLIFSFPYSGGGGRVRLWKISHRNRWNKGWCGGSWMMNERWEHLRGELGAHTLYRPWKKEGYISWEIQSRCNLRWGIVEMQSSNLNMWIPPKGLWSYPKRQQNMLHHSLLPACPDKLLKSHVCLLRNIKPAEEALWFQLTEIMLLYDQALAIPQIVHELSGFNFCVYN